MTFEEWCAKAQYRPSPGMRDAWNAALDEAARQLELEFDGDNNSWDAGIQRAIEAIRELKAK